jgi:hypothetical protein
VEKVPSTKRKKSLSKPKNSVARILSSLLFSKRAVSVALSTMIITAGVVAMGIAVLYWAYSVGNLANKQYSDTVAVGSNAVVERIAFEYIACSGSEVTVNIINWGKANNVSVVRVYIWDSAHELVGSSGDIVLMDITTNAPIPGNTLNMGEEGYFSITASLLPNSYFSIRVVTERGRNFDGSFATR